MFSKIRFLELDEVPHLRTFLHPGFPTEVGERPHGAFVRDLRVHDHAVVQHFDMGADLRVRDPRAGPNGRPLTDFARTLDRDVRVDHRIAADIREFADVGGFRIDKCYTVIEHQPRDRPLTDQPLDIRELAAIVDALDLARITVQEYRHLIAGRVQKSRSVGQVVFALGVLVLYVIKRFEKSSRVEAVDPRVDLLYLSLRIARVFLLDD